MLLLYILCLNTTDLSNICYFLFSKFLYDLYTKEGKLPPIGNTTILQKWLTKIGKELHLNLRCTKALMTRVYKRTSFIVNKIRKLHYRGRQVQEFLQKEWNLELTSRDIKTCRQNIVEKELTSQRDSLLKENKALQSKSLKLEKQVTSLSCQVQKAQSNGFVPSRGSSKRKSSLEYSDRHHRGLKKKRKEKCDNSLAWLQSEGYSATKVMLVNTTTGQEESINLNTDCLLATDESRITDVEMDTINMMLYIKDKYNISGGAYHEMTQLCKGMPRHYKLKERINELNKIWNIQPTPNGTCGVQQSLKERLQFCLHSLVRFVCVCVYYLFT